MTTTALPSATGVGTDFSSAARFVVEHLRARLGLEMWMVTRRRGEDYVVLHLDDQHYGLPDGLVVPWSSTFCAQMVDHGAPRVAPDVSAVPAYVHVREQVGLDVNAYVTVPLVGEEGTVLGTLCGASPRLFPPSLEAEQSLLEVLGGLLGGLLSSELRLEREARRALTAEQEADTDPLTGLGNRRCWDRALAVEEARCLRYGSSAGVLVLDVDHLKQLNDTHGHGAGDVLLRTVGQVLRDNVRTEDVVARLGGDEFGLLLAECDATQLETARVRLGEALTAAGAPACVGAALRVDDGMAGAWQRADSAVYDAKRARASCAAGPVVPVSRQPVDDHVEPGTGLVAELLELARLHLGADVAFLARFEERSHVVRAVCGGANGTLGLRAGQASSLEDSYCARVVDGRLPAFLADAHAHPAAREMPLTRLGLVGSYVTAPVRLADGRLYGTLCCFSARPDPRRGQADADVVTSIAVSIARLLTAEEGERTERSRRLRALDAVLAGRDTTMVFQPLVRLGTRESFGHEALARFSAEPRRGPDAWFADAAALGLTPELELLTARLALQQGSTLPGLLSLNFSATTVCSPAFAGLFAGVDVGRLVVEISEHSEIDDYAAVRAVLDPLRDRGLQLAVDDAGAGFASLRHVVQLSADFIKLDISLVRGIAADPVRLALATALTTFGRQSGGQVLAEGVETAAEHAALLEAGVQLGQGWFYGRPAAADVQ